MFKIWFESHEDKNSWLDVGGEFHPVPTLSHQQYFKKVSGQNFTNYEKAYRQGWTRVTYMENSLYAENMFVLSPRQRNSLINLAIEQRMNRVIWDNYIKRSIIWSREDMI